MKEQIGGGTTIPQQNQVGNEAVQSVGSRQHRKDTERLKDGATNTTTEKNSQKHGSHSKAECSKLIEVDIEIHDKKIVPVPKWENGSTGEEVFDWWIR